MGQRLFAFIPAFQREAACEKAEDVLEAAEEAAEEIKEKIEE